MNQMASFRSHQQMLVTLYTKDQKIFHVIKNILYITQTYVQNVLDILNVIFILWTFFLSFFFENDDMKLMTIYRRSNHTNVFLNFVSTILLHECFIKQACKSHFIADLQHA